MSEAATDTPGVSSRLLYMGHLLDVLRSAGGTLPSTGAFGALTQSGLARQSDLEMIQASGETRFAKEVRFARLELVAASLLNCPRDGVWSLSDAGWGTFLTPADARSLVTARRHGQILSRKMKEKSKVDGPTTGPRPVSHTAIVSRSTLTPTCTYVLRFGETDIWKVGHAGDLADRLSQVNKHVPYEHLGQQWSLFTRMLWPDAEQAYVMEQRLLDILDRHRTRGERVRCPRSDIVDAWKISLTEQGRNLLASVTPR